MVFGSRFSSSFQYSSSVILYGDLFSGGLGGVIKGTGTKIAGVLLVPVF